MHQSAYRQLIEIPSRRGRKSVLDVILWRRLTQPKAQALQAPPALNRRNIVQRPGRWCWLYIG